MSEFQQLMESTVPCARGVLRDNYQNLLKVADYCDSNYEGSEDKRKALEETMSFATQSLASVAYQISTLANDILRILDLQAAEVRQVEASVCSVTQVVEMHKEKVARQRIGMLAVCKRFSHCQKIISPDHFQPLEPYYRKPLNFSSLDDVGHGIKDQSTQLSRTGTLSRRGTKTSTGHSPGSLRRSYRNLEPIQAPVVPDAKLSPASPEASLSDSTGTIDNTSLKAPTEPPPPPSLLSLFPPPMGEDDIPSPLQTDAFLPPPLAMDDLPPFSAPDLDFPATPPPPPLDMPDLTLLGPLILPPPPPLEQLPWAPDTYLEKVVTLYPYVKQKENELSFEEGAVLYVTRRYSDGWCEGVSSEGEGLFPGNYIEPLH